MAREQHQPAGASTRAGRPGRRATGRSEAGPVHALTLVEVLIVLSLLFILAALLLPRLARPRIRSGISCANNLKQVGLAFRCWSIDNQDRFPMQVPLTNGGTLELVNRGSVFPHFLVMSNELSTPKILICPREKEGARRMADTFTWPAGFPGARPFTNDESVSYFVGVDALVARPHMLLAGDRHLAFNGRPPRRGLREVWTNNVVTWSGGRHGDGGNLILADGSLQVVSNAGWPRVLFNTGQPTNRLALP